MKIREVIQTKKMVKGEGVPWSFERDRFPLGKDTTFCTIDKSYIACLNEEDNWFEIQYFNPPATAIKKLRGKIDQDYSDLKHF